MAANKSKTSMPSMTAYVTDNSGKYIPASQRPDGTWRKARRVKDGYVPQEEVPLYESKGKQFAKGRNNGLPPGVCPFIAEQAKKEREKQEKAKAKKEAAAAAAVAAAASAGGVNAGSGSGGSIVGGGAKKKIKSNTQKTPGMLVLGTTHKGPDANANKEPSKSSCSKPKALADGPDLCQEFENNLKLETPSQEVAKKLKKLRKKLREIEATEAKLEMGGIKKPEKDQLEKIKRKGDIQKEIDILEEEINRSSNFGEHNGVA